MPDIDAFAALDDLYKALQGRQKREGDASGADVWYIPLKGGVKLRQGTRIGKRRVRVKWYELQFPDGEDPIQVTSLARRLASQAHEEILVQTIAENAPRRRR